MERHAWHGHTKRADADIPTFRENHNLDDSTTSPPVATFKTNPPSFYTSAKMENERGELVDRKDAHRLLKLGYRAYRKCA